MRDPVLEAKPTKSRAGDVFQWYSTVPSIHKAPGSNPSTTRTERHYWSAEKIELMATFLDGPMATGWTPFRTTP